MNRSKGNKLSIIVAAAILLAIASSVVTYFVTKGRTNKMVQADEPAEVITDTIPEVEPVFRYGLNEDSFNIFENRVGRDENLSDILLDYGLDYAVIYQVANNSREVFNVRKIRRGNPYTMFCAKDSSMTLQVMIYQIDHTDYVVFDLRDSIEVRREQKEIKTRKIAASGTIESSLYETLMNNDINPLVAIKMSEIFAWQIDFYRLQKGDQFKIIFYEDYVDSISVGINHIEAAYFHHFGNEYYGIYFEQDSIGDYFDEKGLSLRKAFLKTPLEYGRMTSRFTYRRFHPVQKRWKAHLGTDYAAPYGTPIRATGAGTVVESRYSKYNGNYVKIRHNSTYTTQYLHMSKRARGIYPGVRVKQGQTIGYVGSTGLATGPHVCYRFWKNGHQVNHRREEFPPSKPVKEEYREAYDATLKAALKNLDKIPFKPLQPTEKGDSLNPA